MDKPFPAAAFPPGPGRPALPPLACVHAWGGGGGVRGGVAEEDLRAWLTPGTLLLVGLRASAEAGLDSWAAAYSGALMTGGMGGEGGGGGGGSGSSGSTASLVGAPSSLAAPPRIVDLTVYDRTPALALALPGMKGALLRGAAAGARARGAAVAAAHFGPAPDLRAALRLGNALAAYAVVVGREGGVAWLGSGVAVAGEAEEMVGVARAEMRG